MSENLLLSSSDKVLDVILNGQTYFDQRGNVIKFKNEICITINHGGEIDSIIPCKSPLDHWIETK